MLIRITVVPASPKFAITQKDGKIKIYLKEKAEENKANIELIKRLEELTGATVRIVSGLKSRQKTIDIPIEKERWEEIIIGFSKK